MAGISYHSLLVFLTGMLGIWKAVPVGFALGEQPFLVWLFTSLGAASAAVILYFFGNWIRTLLSRWKKHTTRKKRDHRAARLLEKYGTAGLGLLGCLLIGPNMTMLLGLVLVKSPEKLLFWTIAGILLWTFALTILAVFSIDLFNQLTA